MIVTGILPQKKGTSKNVYIDGEFSFSASLEDIVKFSISEGMELSKSDLENLILKCEYTKAYDYCLSLLSIRDYVSLEIRKKLKQRLYSENTINNIIEKLVEYNLINDINYAEKYANDSQKIKKYGVNKIKNNLIMRGVNKDIIDSININNEDQYKLCFEVALKKDRLLGECKNKREKVFRFLISRGFEYETVIKVLNNIINNEVENSEDI